MKSRSRCTQRELRRIHRHNFFLGRRVEKEELEAAKKEEEARKKENEQK